MREPLTPARLQQIHQRCTSMQQQMLKTVLFEESVTLGGLSDLLDDMAYLLDRCTLATQSIAALEQERWEKTGPFGKLFDATQRVQRLETAINTVLNDSESQPGGWGPDVTMQGVLRAALTPPEASDHA